MGMTSDEQAQHAKAKEQAECIKAIQAALRCLGYRLAELTLPESWAGPSALTAHERHSIEFCWGRPLL